MVTRGPYRRTGNWVNRLVLQQRQVPLVVAGAMLTVGAIGWTTASWLQSQSWLPVRRDRLGG